MTDETLRSRNCRRLVTSAVALVLSSGMMLFSVQQTPSRMLHLLAGRQEQLRVTAMPNTDWMEPSNHDTAAVFEQDQEDRMIEPTTMHNELDAFLPSYGNDTKIVSYHDLKGMRALAMNLFDGNYCKKLLDLKDNKRAAAAAKQRQTPILVNITFGCDDLFHHGAMGTGNFVSAFYAMRLLARTLGNVTVLIQCEDASQVQDQLVLPWLTGLFPAVTTKPSVPAVSLPSVQQACAPYKDSYMGDMLEDILFEMRRMAIAMVGIPKQGDHPSRAWAAEHLVPRTAAHYHVPTDTILLQQEPFYPNVELDDAILHFRCGDLINSFHRSFGFMKFDSFSRHLDADTESIGICTQPFGDEDENEDNHQQRKEDGGSNGARCRKVVMALVDHLQAQFPNARIRVHNGFSETISLTFARMIMAKQTVVAISSFGVFPALATFGTAFIRKPDYGSAPNRWLLHMTAPRQELPANIKLVTEPRLTTKDCRTMWGEDGAEVIAWFRNYTLPPLHLDDPSRKPKKSSGR